jgi:DNA/RNA endonuclease G (NUC1)
MDETFLLTNIAPQVGAGFNRHCEPSHLHHS